LANWATRALQQTSHERLFALSTCRTAVSPFQRRRNQQAYPPKKHVKSTDSQQPVQRAYPNAAVLNVLRTRNSATPDTTMHHNPQTPQNPQNHQKNTQPHNMAHLQTLRL